MHTHVHTRTHTHIHTHTHTHTDTCTHAAHTKHTILSGVGNDMPLKNELARNTSTCLGIRGPEQM